MRRALSNESGFTMLAVVLCMTAAMGLTLAGWAAAGGDINVGQRDTNSKRAYAAAEAGLADYLAKLSQDNEYWLKCTNVPNLPNGSPPPVNQQWNRVGSDPRRWRVLPSDTQASYTIELLPAPGYTSCQQDVDASMQAADGTIKIRVTGRAGPRGATSLKGAKEVYRSVVATLRRAGFLDYLYFTDYETSDPTQQIIKTAGAPVKRCLPNQSCPNDNLAAWASDEANCTRYVRDGRNSVTYPGSIFTNGAWRTPNPPITCTQIVFIGDDAIKGPFHTNDTMVVCGSPEYGRNRAGNTSAPIDRVEFYSWTAGCGGGTPDFGNNAVLSGANLPILQMPPSNTTLQDDADPAYVFTGKTTIVLNGNSMTVNGNSMAQPANGLIYVRSDPNQACPEFNPLAPYAAAPGCGDVYLRGSYSKSLTIAAARDIVISDDVLAGAGSNALLGLIANNFVRVEHHIVNEASPCDSGDDNAAGTETNRRIDAALLSLGHVFTVDNYQCGNSLGNLTVYGAIAQKYRGPVGTTGGTGYVKDYRYDDRLKYRSPPFFLAPVQSAWRAVRSTEQVPAAY